MALRAFVGVPVEPHPALVGLLEDLAAIPADLKVVAPQNLHLTLAFLGETPEAAVPALSAALDDAARGVAAFVGQLRGVGAFPNVRRPRVVWAGLADPRPLADLATRVRGELARAGHADDGKDFRAHLTLARTRSERGASELTRFLKDHGLRGLPAIPIDEARLYRSVPGPAGPAYETLHVARLEG